MRRDEASAPEQHDPWPAGGRRASRRWPLQAEVEVLEPVQGRGVAINGSEGGMRIAVDCPLAPGLRCRIRTTFGPELERVENARVVWSLAARDG